MYAAGDGNTTVFYLKTLYSEFDLVSFYTDHAALIVAIPCCPWPGDYLIPIFSQFLSERIYAFFAAKAEGDMFNFHCQSSHV